MKHKRVKLNKQQHPRRETRTPAQITHMVCWSESVFPCFWLASILQECAWNGFIYEEGSRVVVFHKLRRTTHFQLQHVIGCVTPDWAVVLAEFGKM